MYETREKVTRNKDIVNVEREEKKGNMIFVTRAMGPSRYFAEYKAENKNIKNLNKLKSRTKIKKKEKEMRRRLRNDKVLCGKVLKIIIEMKINRNQCKIWYEKNLSSVDVKGLIIERKCKEINKVISK